jgi:UDP-glucose 4-epimerase
VLVYGPGAKANFLTMMRWLESGIPLPLASIENRRSFVALDNLVDVLMICAAHPAAANGVFLVSDGEDLSTPELMRRAAAAMGVRARLVPAPVVCLKAAGRLTGRSGMIRRLVESFQVDISHTRARLGWTPQLTIDEGLARAVGTGS